jgi:hypothetical protein
VLTLNGVYLVRQVLGAHNGWSKQRRENESTLHTPTGGVGLDEPCPPKLLKMVQEICKCLQTPKT